MTRMCKTKIRKRSWWSSCWLLLFFLVCLVCFLALVARDYLADKIFHRGSITKNGWNSWCRELQLWQYFLKPAQGQIRRSLLIWPWVTRVQMTKSKSHVEMFWQRNHPKFSNIDFSQTHANLWLFFLIKYITHRWCLFAFLPVTH